MSRRPAAVRTGSCCSRTRSQSHPTKAKEKPMPVRKDENGQRWVEAQAEVPGTPEQVWAAIATGKGISAWFVPTTVEEREGGTSVCSYGPGMDVPVKITRWNPPQSFVAEA